MDTTWIEHRRADGELVGWIVPDGENWSAIDLFGAHRVTGVDWLQAEEALDEIGLSWMADPWMLEVEPGREVRVRIREFVPDRIDAAGERVPGRVVVAEDDFGAIDIDTESFVIAWPPSAIRTLTGDEQHSTWS